MNPWIIVLIVVAVLAALIAVLYFLGRKAQKKQAEQQEMLEANKQTVSMLIIDKKRMRLKDAGLPQMVLDQTPKLMRRSKLPIVKVKVGPHHPDLRRIPGSDYWDVLDPGNIVPCQRLRLPGAYSRQNRQRTLSPHSDQADCLIQ